jgi:hypothetical protein
MKPVGATPHATSAGGEGYKMEFMYEQGKESECYEVEFNCKYQFILSLTLVFKIKLLWNNFI